MRRDNAGASSGQPTVQDVARLAGVSVGTVSNVLSRSHYVRPQTRQRVESAIAELGYRPNRVAQALISKKTNTIGMILPDVANPFFAELLRGAEDVLGQADYALVFGNSDNDSIKERRYVSAFRDRQVDGMIAAIAADSDADEIRALGEEIPMVIVDRLLPGWTGDSVVGNNRGGMSLVVDHLVSLGHRKIALVNGDPRLSTAIERREGFEQRLSHHGLAPLVISEGEFTMQSGREQTASLLTSPRKPTAICAGNDLLALGALAAATQAGLRVPDDLTVAGYDDIAYAQLALPPLTTVWQPSREMGVEAAELMLRRLEDPGKAARQISMQPELVVRRSSAPPGGNS